MKRKLLRSSVLAAAIIAAAGLASLAPTLQNSANAQGMLLRTRSGRYFYSGYGEGYGGYGPRYRGAYGYSAPQVYSGYGYGPYGYGSTGGYAYPAYGGYGYSTTTYYGPSYGPSVGRGIFGPYNNYGAYSPFGYGTY